MKRLERLRAALTPKRWPVRWRLAAVSAVLTFLILVIFALVVGRLTSSRLHSDFNEDAHEVGAPRARRGHALEHRRVQRATGSAHRDVSQRARPAIDIGVRPGRRRRRARCPRSQPPNARQLRSTRHQQSVREAGDLAVASAPHSGPLSSLRPLYRPVRPQHREPRLHDQPPVALPRRGRTGRNRPRRPRRHRDRRSRHAPNRDAHEHGPVDRDHARPLAANPRAGARRRGRRARPDPGPDAATTRRCTVRDRADDAAPA